MTIFHKQNTVLLQLLATLKPIHLNLVPDYNIPPPSPLHTHFVQELFPEDCDRRMECLEIMLPWQDYNPPLKNIIWMCTEPNQEYLMNWKHKFEMLFPLFLLTSEGKVLSRCHPGLAEVCLHNNTVLKSGTK